MLDTLKAKWLRNQKITSAKQKKPKSKMKIEDLSLKNKKNYNFFGQLSLTNILSIF